MRATFPRSKSSRTESAGEHAPPKLDPGHPLGPVFDHAAAVCSASLDVKRDPKRARQTSELFPR